MLNFAEGALGLRLGPASNKGMTLVELVVAVIILEFVLMGFGFFFSQSMLWMAKSGQNAKNYAGVKGVSDNILAEPGDILDVAADASDTRLLTKAEWDARYILNPDDPLLKNPVVEPESDAVEIKIKLRNDKGAETDGGSVSMRPVAVTIHSGEYVATYRAGGLRDGETDAPQTSKASDLATTYHVYVP